MPKALKEGAIFIADAHYPHHGDDFLKLLKKIDNGEVQTLQLFLMGDVFDLLFGHNEYIKTFSKEAIRLLQKLSKTLEIHYIEGNHDFCLKELFPSIQVYPREVQPIHFKLGNKEVYLTHGDKYERGIIYNLYTWLLRKKTTLTILKPFEEPLINHRMNRLKAKDICGYFKGYKERFNAILSHYPKESLVIEGHFHQGVFHKNYISLPSLVCQKKVARVEGGEIVFREID